VQLVPDGNYFHMNHFVWSALRFEVSKADRSTNVCLMGGSDGWVASIKLAWFVTWLGPGRVSLSCEDHDGILVSCDNSVRWHVCFYLTEFYTKTCSTNVSE
jgi:hypothetical protein